MLDLLYSKDHCKSTVLTCLSFSSYLIRDGISSLWEVMATDAKSLKSAMSFIVYYIGTDSLPKYGQLSQSMFSNEINWPVL